MESKKEVAAYDRGDPSEYETDFEGEGDDVTNSQLVPSEYLSSLDTPREEVREKMKNLLDSPSESP
jgi:hypothetical protein